MEMEQEEAWGSSKGDYLGNHFQGISHPVSLWHPPPLVLSCVSECVPTGESTGVRETQQSSRQQEISRWGRKPLPVDSSLLECCSAQKHGSSPSKLTWSEPGSTMGIFKHKYECKIKNHPTFEES